MVEYRNEEGNKIFETKTWDYVKNRKKEQNEIDKFCGFNNSEKSFFLIRSHSSYLYYHEILS